MRTFEHAAPEYSSLQKEDFKLHERDDAIHDAKFETKSVGFFKDAMLRFGKNTASIIAFIIICIIAFFSILGPMMNEYGYNDQDLNRANLPARIPGCEKINLLNGSTVLKNRRKDNLTDTEKYPEGCILEITNESVVNGVKMCDGSIAGYYGGMVDMVMMRIAEIIQAFPNIVVMTLFIMYFGNGLFAIIMALVVRDWVGTATLIRAQFYRFKDSEYVLAARTLGTKDRTLIFRHILPNAIGPIVTRTMIAIPSAIFAESFLAYIGLGIRAPEASLGVLLSHAQTVLLQYPYQTVFPAALISVLMISFNLFGNGLRDAFDPTQRGT